MEDKRIRPRKRHSSKSPTIIEIENSLLENFVFHGIKDLLQLIGENPDREGLRETPKRFIKAFKEMTVGYRIDPKSVLKTFSSEGYDQMVTLRQIPFISLCEHHLLSFTGTVDIAYIPGKKIIGLSKLARLVEIYARRLQVQERLTDQIASTLFTVLKPKGVGVRIQGQHSCMCNRGIGKTGTMVTTSLQGNFKNPDVKQEFLQ